VVALSLTSLVACGTTVAPTGSNVKMLQGPPIEEVRTPFDNALSCLRGKINPNVTFSVGAIIDQSGKEQITEGGSGKFVTQGAGDIVQSALFRAGVTVLNRRDPRIIEQELRWGITRREALIPSRYFVTGSINSLDFIPGGGADVQIAGIGAKARQTRILVGLDLSVTDAKTGRVVANIPLNKQIVANEKGISSARFFGETLVNLDIGGKQREAINFALRQMLNLATFELLVQMMPREKSADCRSNFQALTDPVPPITPLPVVPAPAKPGMCSPSAYQVRFGFDEDKLDEETKLLLDKAIVEYKQCGLIKFTVAGHADRAGTDDYNQRLSERRVENVKQYLQARGVDVQRVQFEALGEKKPVVATPDGVPEAANRRVEMVPTYAPTTAARVSDAPAIVAEDPAEVAATEEEVTEQAATEDVVAEEAVTEEAATEEATEEAATEEASAEPAATAEAATEDATEEAATEEASAEPAAAEEAVAEEVATEEVAEDADAAAETEDQDSEALKNKSAIITDGNSSL